VEQRHWVAGPIEEQRQKTPSASYLQMLFSVVQTPVAIVGGHVPNALHFELSTG
jgi:hypothetical protein